MRTEKTASSRSPKIRQIVVDSFLAVYSVRHCDHYDQQQYVRPCSCHLYHRQYSLCRMLCHIRYHLTSDGLYRDTIPFCRNMFTVIFRSDYSNHNFIYSSPAISGNSDLFYHSDCFCICFRVHGIHSSCFASEWNR